MEEGDSRGPQDTGEGGQNPADDDKSKEEWLRNYKPQNQCMHGNKRSYFCKLCRDEYNEYVRYKKQRGEPYIEFKHAFCVHDKQRNQCNDCRHEICDHNTQRRKCLICTASKGRMPKNRKKCYHGITMEFCKACFIEYMAYVSDCETRGVEAERKYFCFCKHLKRKSLCAECDGRAICVHSKDKYQCKQCKTKKEAEKRELRGLDAVGEPQGSGVEDALQGFRAEDALQGFRAEDALQGFRAEDALQGYRVDDALQTLEEEDELQDVAEDEIWKHLDRQEEEKITIRCSHCSEALPIEHFPCNDIGMTSTICNTCTDSANHQAMTKKIPTKQRSCPHKENIKHCKECGYFCIHGRDKYKCKECGGKSICLHGHLKYLCKECKGSGICTHGKQKRTCKVCYVRCAGGCSRFIPRHDGASSSTGPDPSLCEACQIQGRAP
jgi:hypothetical protein